MATNHEQTACGKPYILSSLCDILLIDIWQILIDYVDINTGYMIINSHEYFSDNLYIYNIPHNYASHFTQNTHYIHNYDTFNRYLSNAKLKKKCFNKLQKLDLMYNNRVYDINHLTLLEYLYLGCDSNVNDKNIQNLVNLVEFTAGHNIRNINHMKNLARLHASDTNCRVGDDGIRDLSNIQILIIWGNMSITNVNHLTNLLDLDASGHMCGIDDDGIRYLSDLVRLKCSNNRKISKINHMYRSLKILYAESDCGINDQSLTGLDLVELHVCDNPQITNVNHLARHLRELDASGERCGIADNGIQDCSNITLLQVTDNAKVTNVQYTMKNVCSDHRFRN